MLWFVISINISFHKHFKIKEVYDEAAVCNTAKYFAPE